MFVPPTKVDCYKQALEVGPNDLQVNYWDKLQLLRMPEEVGFLTKAS